MKNLATIQKIKNIRKHPNADSLCVGNVLGWQVVFNNEKDSYKEDDLVIYTVIDTVLPDNAQFEFLRNKKFKIKPIKLRGIESAGIIFPVNTLTFFGYDMREPLSEGMDVTDIIGVKHFEKPVPFELAGQAIGTIPGFVIITDEDNLRTYPNAIPEMYGRQFYITRKDDGSSGTFLIKGGEFNVCSRRINLKENESNGFWKMAHKYDIKNVLLKTFPDTDIAIQGEVCGPGIQKNKLGLTSLEFHLFNIFDITKRTYLDYDKIVQFSQENNIPMVTVISEGVAFGHNLEELVQLANQQKYPTGGPAEGIVIRPKESFLSNELGKAWSGKVLNELYIEKD